MRRYGLVAGVLALGVLFVGIPGCSLLPGHHKKSLKNHSGPPATRLSLDVTPATGTKELPISSEIGLKLNGGRISSVSLAAQGGRPLAGALRDDGSSWVPANPLSYATTYTATVAATSPDGAQALTRTTKFTTMHEPYRQTDTGLYMLDGETYGVAMPVVVAFDPPVSDGARAGIQKRLFVTSDPPQPGVWHWTGGDQVLYRPPAYWKPGTKITVRAALAGQPMGNGYYGDVDRSATASIGDKVVMDVSNRTKQMKVYVKDRLVRTIPVSLGKPSTPSSSGHMVVMTHEYTTLFDTTREGPGGYRVWVNYAMRLTWGGEFIHAAPWSVGDQGYRNVSHGCVNMSWDNAKWLFAVARIGDPVTVTGTEVALREGNGWTAWNLPWAQYVKGSALPVPAPLAAGNPGGAADPGQAPGPGNQAEPAPTPSKAHP
jgi:lipoprotein-anchoring transpeptidase ErfK/SrfK